MFDLILVPQGAEYAAVRRGIQRAQASIALLPIAMGPEATTTRIEAALTQGGFQGCQSVLVLGVAGSLSPDLGVGDRVIYQRLVVPSEASGKCPDSSLTGSGTAVMTLQRRLPQAQRVTALASDRLIHRAEEKQALQPLAQVVDMEAAAIAQCLAPLGIEIATVRVISDRLNQPLPDLSAATAADGSLDSLKLARVLAIALLRQPHTTLQFIQGSLRAIQVLEQVTEQIFRQSLGADPLN